MNFSNVIFDLDGTLADSLPGIENSMRLALATCQPERTLPSMRSLIGPPIASMLARLWPDLREEELTALVTEYRRQYDDDGWRRSELFPGVLETLTALHRRSVDLFVLTNKPLHASRRILEHTGILPLCKDVVSPDSIEPPFNSKSSGAQWLRGKHNLDPAVTLLMGDGADDLKAAAHCGFSFAAAAYGYGNAAVDGNSFAVAIVTDFPEIERVVLQPASLSL
jgi:phosphoglycolate phosphatase